MANLREHGLNHCRECVDSAQCMKCWDNAPGTCKRVHKKRGRWTTHAELRNVTYTTTSWRISASKETSVATEADSTEVKSPPSRHQTLPNKTQLTQDAT